MLFQKLYVRIWLAVVLAVAVLTLLVGWVWRLAADPPLREMVVRNTQGEILGKSVLRKAARAASVPGDDAEELPAQHRGRFGEGPEFLVRMQDGSVLHMHLPRPPNPSWRAMFGFWWMLGLVAVAVALGTYPIVRRLTRRLEILQRGVERWGDGELGLRVALQGDDEVGFLAQRFNRAAEQIETLVKSHQALLASQKSMLANASHELRSPLARLRMGLELMGGQPTAAVHGEIARNITELDQLIEEILLASRLDAHEADLGTVEAVDLIGLAAEECARVQAVLELHVELLLVPGVAKLLRRAVRNLLDNARRHGAGEVTLELLQEQGQAVIRVCDRGPGVPEQLQARVFEPFYRVPGASERDGGVGLGLALVKSIALRHAGSVLCCNRTGGGACFEIRLPSHADPQPKQEATGV